MTDGLRSGTALDGVSFSIEPGERVAFVGPNGAGKSTTLKILCGILHPSSGHVRVLGLEPWRARRALGYRIGTVFGQRSQLWYHLPARDSFDLLARVYDRDDADHRRRRAELSAAFGIGALVGKPVRQLSLGERMRCEIVASLLHAPEILFLDEPTIGLDVTDRAVIRHLARDEARSRGRTVLLTSHDTGDMEAVCERVLVIHRGHRLPLAAPHLLSGRAAGRGGGGVRPAAAAAGRGGPGPGLRPQRGASRRPARPAAGPAPGAAGGLGGAWPSTRPIGLLAFWLQDASPVGSRSIASGWGDMTSGLVLLTASGVVGWVEVPLALLQELRWIDLAALLAGAAAYAGLALALFARGLRRYESGSRFGQRA